MSDRVAEAGLQYLSDEVGSVVLEGYKQTEVGVIPDDWDVACVGELFQMQLGKMLDENKNTGIVKLMLGNRGVQWGRIDSSSLGMVRLSRSDLKRYRLEIGDVLVCEGGEVGRSAIWMGEVEECYFQKALHRLRPKNGFSTSLFVNYLQWLSGKGGLSNFVTQTSIAHLPKDKFELVPLAIPSQNDEQTAIANALSDIDALISEQEKLIAKKQAIKTATMQQLLTGRTRLPQFALREDGTVKGYKQSELGEVPEDWDVLPFRAVLTVRHGKDQKSVEDESGDYPIFGTGGQMGFSKKFIYDKPSVLIGRKGSINKPRYCDEPFWTVDTLFYSEISQDADARFLYYKFCMIDWMQFNEASGVPSLNASTIEKVAVSMPKKEEQMQISVVFTELDTSIKKQLHRLNKIRRIKQGMMQELLTGRTRLLKPLNEDCAND